MSFSRGLGRWSGVGLWGLVPILALGLLPAAVLDRGPSGEVRPTLFPLALVALDPFVWDCARNSLIVSGIVSLLSLVLGVNLARLVTRRRFWGRPILVVLASALLVVPPFVGALGLRLIFGEWLDPWATAGLGRWFGWFCWIWVASIAGTPMVGLAAGAALARLEPGWGDAARLAGASPYRAWHKVDWPLIRPAVAQAAATVFTLTLLEPGAPILLGLRRTLAFQAVEALNAEAPFPRAAILVLMAVGLAAVVRMLTRWWGGTGIVLPPRLDEAHPLPLSPGMGILSLLLVSLAVFLAWFPTFAVVLSALKPSWMGLVGHTEEALRLAKQDAWSMVFHSVGLGIAVIVVQSFMVAGLAANRGSLRRMPRLLLRWPEAVPPLALGIGALALPWLLGLADATRSVSGRSDGLTQVLRWFEAVLGPGWSSGILLVLAVAVSMQPLIVAALGAGRGGFRSELYDAALTHGASTRWARRLATGLAFTNSPGVLSLIFCLAASNLAPALALTLSSASRTVGPGILAFADQSQAELLVSTRLATLLVFANLTSLGFALRGHYRSAGQWLRPVA